MATITTDILQLIIQADQADAQEVLKNWRKSVDDAKAAQEALGIATDASTAKVGRLSPEISEASRVASQLADAQNELRDATQSVSQASGEASQAHEDVAAAAKEASETYEDVADAAAAASSEQDKYADAANESKGASDEMSESTAKNTENLKRYAIQLITSYFTIREGIKLFKEMVRLGAENIDSYMRLEGVLQATGNTIGYNAAEIKAMASELRKSTGLAEATIISAAAGLSVFQNISGEVFSRTLELSADLASLWGEDFTAAAKKLGRAMEDPSRGIKQLRESGVVLTAETEQQIRKFMELGEVYQAQQILLAELDRRVGGLSETMNDSASGSLRQFKTVWQELWGAIGEDILGTWWFQGLLVSIDGFLDKRQAGKISGELNFQQLQGSLDQYISQMSSTDLEVALKIVEDEASSKNVLHMQGNYIKNQQSIAEALRERLAIQKQIEASEAQAAADAASREQNARERADREAALLDKEKQGTTELAALYAMTAEGQKKLAADELAALQERLEIDRTAVEWWEQSGYEAPPWIDEARKRIPMYDAVIQQKVNELAELNKVEPSAVEQAMKALFGDISASDFSMNIPLSFDFGRTQIETMEEQLSVLSSKINEVWSAGPAEGDSGEWQSALDDLYSRYSGISEELEKQKKFVTDQKNAKAELKKLLTDQEAAELALVEYAAVMAAYEHEGLITADERAALYDLEAKRLGLAAEEAKGLKDHLEEMTDALKDQFFTADAMGSRISGVFSDIGSAMAAGKDGMDAISDGLQAFASDILGQISSMAIAAGLRMIVELGVAGIPAAIGLFALGGVAGIGAGFFSSSGSGIDSSIMASLDEEVKVREKLNEQLQEQLDVEVDLLRRQLDRNLISVEDYLAGVTEIKGQRTFGDAQSDVLDATRTKLTEIDSKLSSMSGWDKFWSDKDENLESQSDRIAALAAQVNTATADELRSIISQLQELGVDLSTVPKFASGGDFVTNGPMLAMLGDNRSGREHVRITPLGSSGSPAASSTVIINGGIWGVEDLYKKLEMAGVKIGDRNQ